MAEKISFDLVSPERLLLSDKAEMVELPGGEGDMGVMVGHMPLITTLRPGFVAVSGGDSGNAKFLVMGGFAEVTAESCTVLAEEALPAAELTDEKRQEIASRLEADIAACKSEAERAKKQMQLDCFRQLRP